jgi:hypothetical protein
MKTCPKCHELVGIHATYCYNCRHTFDVEDSIKYICLECGKPLNKASSLCTCGGRATSVHTNSESTNNNINNTDTRFLWFRKKSRKTKLILLSIMFLFLCFYVFVFFTKGITYETAFLKKYETNHSVVYSGVHNFKFIEITATGLKNIDESSKLIFQLPNGLVHHYEVRFDNPNNWDSSGFTILKDGNVINKGTYDKYGYLKDMNNNYIDDNITISFNRDSFYDDNYEVKTNDIISFALDQKVLRYRGNPYLLLIGTMLLLFTLVDYLFPTLFFQLKYAFSVHNPEPSYLYEEMQKLSWWVFPIVSIFLILSALIFR